MQRNRPRTLTHTCAHTSMFQVCSFIPSHNYLLSIYHVSVMMVGSGDEAVNRQNLLPCPAHGPGRGPSQGTTLPLGPEQNSKGQAGETRAHSLPQEGLGRVAVCTRNPPTSSWFPFTFWLPLSRSLHTHSRPVPVPSSISDLLAVHIN